MKKNLLDNISKTTLKAWYETETARVAKYGEYRYSLGVNGLGEVILDDWKAKTTIAKGNRAVTAKLKELVK